MQCLQADSGFALCEAAFPKFDQIKRGLLAVQPLHHRNFHQG